MTFLLVEVEVVSVIIVYVIGIIFMEQFFLIYLLLN